MSSYRNDLSNVMNKRKIEMDNKLLVFAIQRTANFEQLLDKRFVGKSLASSQTDLQNENWKPFIGIISQCFDHHFDIYVNFTDQYFFYFSTKKKKFLKLLF